MSNYCPTCDAWLPAEEYSAEHDDTHKKFAIKWRVYCDCTGTKYLRNCKFCNPYICPCGSTIANSKNSVNVHSRSKKHMHFTTAYPDVVIPPAREDYEWAKPDLMN